MKRVFVGSLALCIALLTTPVHAQNRGIMNTYSSPQAKLRRIDMDDVGWTRGFWGDRFALCRDVTVHSIYDSLQHPENAAYLPFQGRDLPTPTAGIVDITLIPYYAWANRGPSYMEVWIPLAR